MAGWTQPMGRKLMFTATQHQDLCNVPLSLVQQNTDALVCLSLIFQFKDISFGFSLNVHKQPWWPVKWRYYYPWTATKDQDSANMSIILTDIIEVRKQFFNIEAVTRFISVRSKIENEDREVQAESVINIIMLQPGEQVQCLLLLISLGCLETADFKIQQLKTSVFLSRPFRYN